MVDGDIGAKGHHKVTPCNGAHLGGLLGGGVDVSSDMLLGNGPVQGDVGYTFYPALAFARSLTWL